MMIKQVGRYVLIEEINRGGMSTVFRGHDPKFQRDVAVKLLPPQFTHDPSFITRFNNEAHMLARLEHRAIVPVYDFGEEQGYPYMVMRLMTGGSLAQRLAHSAMSPGECVRIIARIAPGLDFAHQLGIIHRDLKPGNILFDSDDEAYLSDFGIAKIAEATAELTGSSILGTPAYMSPEQAKGGLKLDGRSDIYALGVILFEMLSGQVPYKADTPVQQLLKHILEPVPHITHLCADTPAAIDSVITIALAKLPDQRFDSAVAFGKALAEAVRESSQPPFVSHHAVSQTPTASPPTAVQTAPERPDEEKRPFTPATSHVTQTPPPIAPNPSPKQIFGLHDPETVSKLPQTTPQPRPVRSALAWWPLPRWAKHTAIAMAGSGLVGLVAWSERLSLGHLYPIANGFTYQYQIHSMLRGILTGLLFGILLTVLIFPVSSGPRLRLLPLPIVWTAVISTGWLMMSWGLLPVFVVSAVGLIGGLATALIVTRFSGVRWRYLPVIVTGWMGAWMATAVSDIYRPWIYYSDTYSRLTLFFFGLLIGLFGMGTTLWCVDQQRPTTP